MWNNYTPNIHKHTYIMSKESVLGVLRHILTFGGGLAVSKGYIDEASSVELVGAAITIIGVAWSIIEKKKKSEDKPVEG